MMDTKDLRRLAQAATPGPWEISEDHRFPGVHAWGEVVFGGSFCDYSEPIKADQAFIAAANPAAVIELLDRLEAAEKERDWHAERCEDAMNECQALRAKIEGVEDERMIDERRIADLMADLNRVGHENDALRAKVAEMEKQGPVAWTTKLALELGKDTLGFHICIRNLWGDKGIPLYALPGAKGEEK